MPLCRTAVSRVLSFALVLFCAPGLAQDDDATGVAVPAPLQPWVPWVLHGQEEARCPRVDVDAHRCSWPGPLDLEIGARGGSFTQRWTLWKDEDVPLPGGGDRWPQGVVVDGKRAVVLDRGGVPVVRLPAGEHAISGRFLWDEQPESLTIPAQTALFSVRVGGRVVLFPRREGADVYFDRDDEEDDLAREEDSLDVAVFRKVVDDVPLMVETRMVLDVAGKAREVTVPWALLPGFQASSVQGPVPVRVEGTSLRAQVRPGSHTIVVVGRTTQQSTPLTAPPAFEEGPPEEIWVYEARPSLRIAHVEGPPSIAADQTRLPDDWRNLPAWRLLPGETMKLVEDRRGDADPPPSQLTLRRTLWLDFDGKGATARDVIEGTFHGDRLEMAPGTTLGRVSVAGKDSFITSLDGGPPGVELRTKNLHVVADSRIDGTATIPAVSWAHDFQSARIDLQLPPGFSLVNASGVDSVSDAWVKRWSLFEIFLVVVLAGAILRLWGPLFAVLAAAAFVLTFQEEGAPVGSWVVVVVLAGLHTGIEAALPHHARHPALRALAWVRVGVGVVVALITLSFAVDQVRVGMYPTLAQPWRVVGDGSPGQGGYSEDETMPAAAPPPPSPQPTDLPERMAAPMGQKDKAEEAQEQIADGEGFAAGGGSYGAEDGVLSMLVEKKASSVRKAKPKKQMTTVDPDAVVQTGPGLPRWGFSSVTLAFSGPVQAGQTISLWLLSPWQNLVLALLRVGLLAVLVLAALGFPGKAWPALLRDPFRRRGAVWLTGLVLLSASSTARAQMPDPQVLEELRERLLAPPPCGESCVEIASMTGEATATTLRLAFEVHAGAHVAVPLPAADGQWTPRTILVDGRPADALRDDAQLLVRVAPGVHDVVLEGPLPQRPSVQLALPIAPRRGALRSTAWSVDGVHADGAVDDNLQLSRVESTKKPEETTGELPPSVLPPFLLVERIVQLGLTFEVETRVVRMSPAGTPIVVDVPLLAGESVTTDGVRAETKEGKGVVKVNLGPNDAEMSWHGTLAQAETLTLTAPTGVPWMESWIVEESPLWHVTKAGIPAVHGGTSSSSSTYRPWPSESLTLSLVRPTGVPGQTLTIDSARLRVSPGLRSTDATLTLSLRSSRGAQHPVTLPAGATLLSATINGASTPLRPVDGVVTVPLTPGPQEVVLATRLPAGVGFATASPRFDVGHPATNLEAVLDLPDDRWVLFCWGPRTGPAVLFWSFLVVIVLAAAGLSRVPVSPLKAHQWVLLSLGLTQVPIVVAATVAGWLLLLGWRKTPLWSERGRVHDLLFDFFQLCLVGATFVGLGGLVAAIQGGLLGAPDMQITGNGSAGTSLRWFADRGGPVLPVVTAWSVPIVVFRVAMLLWSFWLVQALLRWLKDGFKAFGSGGFYREPWKITPRSRKTTDASVPHPPDKLQVPEAPAGAPTSAAGMSTTSATSTTDTSTQTVSTTTPASPVPQASLPERKAPPPDHE